jgi:glycosyltransferase involved in cell wall biosynthesis
MKVLCLIDSWVAGGGAQRQMAGLASILNEIYDVRVLSYWNVNFWDEYFKNNGVNFHTITDATNLFTKFYKVYQYVKKYNPDVIIAYLDSPSVIACLIRILVGKKFYLIVSERNTTQRLSFRERMRFFLYRWTDSIVPNSYTQTEFIQRHFPNLSGKVVTITNFTDMDYFICKPVNKDKSGILNMIVVARIAVQKNVLRFIETIHILNQKGYKIKINWFGFANPESYYQECVNKVWEYQLENIIYFREPTNEIAKEYHKSDVFCLPSIFEGYPNVLCEAMSCGLPVLCSDICDNPKIIERERNGYLFSPFSVDDMVSAIIKFIELPEKKKKEMALQSRVIAEKKFSKEIFKQKYIELIEKAKYGNSK